MTDTSGRPSNSGQAEVSEEAVQQALRVCELAADFILVMGLDDVLPDLAKLWQQQVGFCPPAAFATAVYVPAGSELHGGLAVHTRKGKWHRCPPEELPAPQELLPYLAKTLGRKLSPESAQRLSCPMPGSAEDDVGAVVLRLTTAAPSAANAGGKTCSLPVTDLSPLQTLSGRLIEEAIQRDRWTAQILADSETRRKEMLDALAEFAAGAGHEINNPLATITGRVSQLLRDETDPDRRRLLSTIGGQALRIRDMIGDVMLFARPPKPAPEPVDLGTAVQNVLDKLQPDIQQRGCMVRFSPPESAVTVFADPAQLADVISQLLRNSLEAVDEDAGQIVIECLGPETETGPPADRTADSDRMARLKIIDNGCGLSEKDRQHLFDPFYSGRQAGRGLGFGLCKCWRIVSNHGGRITVSSPPGETVFTVEWPLAR